MDDPQGTLVTLFQGSGTGPSTSGKVQEWGKGQGSQEVCRRRARRGQEVLSDPYGTKEGGYGVWKADLTERGQRGGSPPGL